MPAAVNSISFSKLTVKISEVSKKIFKNSYLTKLIPAIFALFFVWFGNGIWHGASWKYICYGLYYYVIMVIGMVLEPLFNKIITWFKINKETFSYKLWQMLRTTTVVIFGMMLFRSHRLKDFIEMFKLTFTTKNLSDMIEI